MNADDQGELRTSDVARVLGVDESTVYRHAIARRIRWRKTLGGQRRFQAAEVERVRALLAAGETLPVISDEEWEVAP
jgi:excisionase family DNA binding protein